jgi:hypothetical protein
MNPPISLILDAKGAEGRLRRVFQQGAECEAAHQSLITTETSIWIVSLALVILGIMKAAYSSESVLWLVLWPAPLALISTTASFLRQGYYCRNGVLVLGRPYG